MLKKLSLAVAVASTTLTGMAYAETIDSPAGKFDVSMTTTLATDYISRGNSYNNGNPTIQGSLDVAHESGLYVGVWGSSLANDQKTSGAEFDYYIGFAGSITEDVSYDVSVATYVYSGTTWTGENGPENAPSDIEYVGSLSAYGATVGVKYRSKDVKQMYYHLGYDLELPAGFGLSASVGQTQFDDKDDGDDYVDWRVGVSKTLIGLDLGLAYASNDIDENDDHFVFSVSKTF